MKKLIVCLILLIACNSYGEVRTVRGKGCRMMAGMRQSMIFVFKKIVKNQIIVAKRFQYTLHLIKFTEKNLNMIKGSDRKLHIELSMLKKNAIKNISDSIKSLSKLEFQFKNVSNMQKEVEQLRNMLDSLTLEIKMAYKLNLQPLPNYSKAGVE